MEQSHKPIGEILKALQSSEHYGVSREIDIAKGVNKYPTTFKDGVKILYRRWQSRKI